GALDNVHQLDSVIVTIPQKNLGFRSNKTRILVQKEIGHITQGPDHSANLSEHSFVFMQAPNRPQKRIVAQLVLDDVNLTPDGFEHWIIVIDKRIEQRIGKIVSAGLSNPAFATPNARAHRLEDIEVGFLLKRNEKGFAEEHADLSAG